MLDTLISMASLGGLSFIFTSSNSWSLSINFLFFSLTWMTLVLSHPPLRIELIGTAVIRVLFFWIPSVLFVAFDAVLPSLSSNIKLQRTHAVPTMQSDFVRRAVVAGIAALNMALTLLLQAGIEHLLVNILHHKSALRITSTLPLPGELLWGIVRGILFREAAVYYIHRYLLHNHGRLAGYHKSWQHSISAPWSVVAHYDHPVCNVVGRWIPTYAPAVMFRFHLLTWFLFLAVVSVEEAMTYSGYTAVWSMLGGATRRTDRHFPEGGKGNYSPWGVLDWAHGTTVGAPGVKEDAKEVVAETKGRRRSRRRRRRAETDSETDGES